MRYGSFSHYSLILRSIITVAALIFLSGVGCASKHESVVQWVSHGRGWPAPPERPRIRFIGQIGSKLSAAQNHNFWDELFYGPAPPPRMITPQAVAVDQSGDRIAVADTNAGGVHLFDPVKNSYDFLTTTDLEPIRKTPNGTSGRAKAHGSYEYSDRSLTTTHSDTDGNVEDTSEGEDEVEGKDEDKSKDSAPGAPVALCWGGGSGETETLYVADAARGCVVAFQEGKVVGTIGTGDLTRPAGIAFDTQRDVLYVSDAAAHQILQFTSGGRFVKRIGTHGNDLGQFNFPTHLACTSEGDLLVADTLNFRILRFAPDGILKHAFGQKGDAGGDFALPKGVAVDRDGNLWVVDAQFENVQGFTPDGKLLMSFGGEGHGPGEFWLPSGLAIDARNRMWIADTYNRRVQVFELETRN